MENRSFCLQIKIADLFNPSNCRHQLLFHPDFPCLFGYAVKRMPLNKEAVEELRDILRREYNKELSHEEAWEAALNLFNFFTALTQLNNRIDSTSPDESASKDSNGANPTSPQ